QSKIHLATPCRPMLGRAHPGFRSWRLPRCIDQGVDLRLSAQLYLRVAASLQRAAADPVGSQTAAKSPYPLAHDRVEPLAPFPKTSLVVVDPGHFHATLVQQQMYPELPTVARVYAPLGPDLIEYLSHIARYIRRSAEGKRERVSTDLPLEESGFE